MLKFNSRNILSGYIKQLLYSFYLPTCKVFKNKSECEDYFKDCLNSKTREIIYNTNIIVIIKEFDSFKNYFVKVNLNNGELKLEPFKQYRYNHFYPNLTKKLNLTNDLYDSYTHRYLGEYLRFIKDYFDFNLMSMYNCYDNTIENYNNKKYLVIPIKYNKNYSIFCNSDKKITYVITNNTNPDLGRLFNRNKEDNKDIKEEIKHVPKQNNKSCIVIEPYSFNNLEDFFKEDNLRLIIETNIENENPIVILEGDYSNYKPYTNIIQANYERKKEDKFIYKGYINGQNANSPINRSYEYSDDYYNYYNDSIQTSNFQLIEKLKVDNNNYPIADRLIEYLIGNVITDLDRISKNIIDAKTKLNYRYYNYPKGELNKIDGKFTIMDRFKMLEVINKNIYYRTNKEDLLGYVDKDVEGVLDDERYVGGKVNG